MNGRLQLSGLVALVPALVIVLVDTAFASSSAAATVAEPRIPGWLLAAICALPLLVLALRGRRRRRPRRYDRSSRR